LRTNTTKFAAFFLRYRRSQLQARPQASNLRRQQTGDRGGPTAAVGRAKDGGWNPHAENEEAETEVVSRRESRYRGSAQETMGG
jgi:hypothetical protein